MKRFLQKMSLALGVFAGLAAGGMIGCFSPGSVTPSSTRLTFAYRHQHRESIVRFSAYLQASDSQNISLRDGAYGTIEWLKPEGSLVASGEVIVRISMTDVEDRFRFHQTELRHARENAGRFEIQTPSDRSKLLEALHSRQRELVQKRFDRAALERGKLPEERWRVVTDFQKAAVEDAFAAKTLTFQKQVADRGFDSPLGLREKEIEARSRSVQADFSRRLEERLSEPPPPEEAAKASQQIDLASGEVWLASTDLENASPAAQMERKARQFNVESHSSSYRRLHENLAQKEIRAPMSGLLIYPVFWGNQKAAPGTEVWDEMVFLKVVSTGSFVLEASVDETTSSQLTAGLPASITMDPFPGQVMSGRVMLVGKVGRRMRIQGRSELKRFPIQLSIETGAVPVRFGEKAMVSVVTASASGVFLPRDAVRGGNGSASVSLEGVLGFSEIPAKVEPFDHDFHRWIDAPASSGNVRF